MSAVREQAYSQNLERMKPEAPAERFSPAFLQMPWDIRTHLRPTQDATE
jgi:hypothetical protein